MQFKKAKLFWGIYNDTKKIFCISYDDKIEYYTFLKQCHNNGYRQIIITSEIMIKLIEFFVVENNFTIYKLEFMEDDDELQMEIRGLFQQMTNNIAFLSKFIEKLNFLSEKSSIEIKRIYFKGRDKKGVASQFYLQSNGIIGINKENFSFVSNSIGSLIERYLF